MPLDVTVACSLQLTLQGDDVLGTPPLYEPAPFDPIILADGVTADQADLVYAATREISASSSEELDLAGVLIDPLGTLLTFAKIRVLLIEADENNINNVEVGGSASNAFLGWFKDATDIKVLTPGDRIMLTSRTAGKVVTAGTGDKLKFTNSGGVTPVTYRIMIVGTSA